MKFYQKKKFLITVSIVMAILLIALIILIVSKGKVFRGYGPEPGTVIIYVDSMKGQDYLNGLSWETAKKTIMAAINTCNEHHNENPDINTYQIWVAQGDYVENVVIGTATFEIKLYGGFFGDELSLEQKHGRETIIKPLYQGGPVVNIWYSNRLLINGFTIQDGVGNMGDPGGVFINESENTTISHCIIKNNSQPSLSPPSRGGGIYITSSNNYIIENSQILDNSADWGGGIAVDDSFGQIYGNFISNNTADQGSALFLDQQADDGDQKSSIYNNVLTKNTATSKGTVFARGLYNDILFYNNTIDSNISQDGVSGIFIQQDLLDEYVLNVRNNSFSKNQSSGGWSVIDRLTVDFYDFSYNNFFDNTNDNGAAPDFSPPDDRWTQTQYHNSHYSTFYADNNNPNPDDPLSYQLTNLSGIKNRLSANFPLTDYLGVSRPQPSGGLADIGAFEYDSGIFPPPESTKNTPFTETSPTPSSTISPSPTYSPSPNPSPSPSPSPSSTHSDQNGGNNEDNGDVVNPPPLGQTPAKTPTKSGGGGIKKVSPTPSVITSPTAGATITSKPTQTYGGGTLPSRESSKRTMTALLIFLLSLVGLIILILLIRYLTKRKKN